MNTANLFICEYNSIKAFSLKLYIQRKGFLLLAQGLDSVFYAAYNKPVHKVTFRGGECKNVC